MNSERAKVLHEICGRPMLSYVVNACRLAGVNKIVVVVGYGKDDVVRSLGDDPGVEWVEQAEQKGTGHAVQCCAEALKGFSGSVLVIAGDMPLVRRVTLAGLIQSREKSGDSVTLATTHLDDPTGYGRIVRDGQGRLEAIVEHRDCTELQQQIREVNPSYYCFDSARLFEALNEVQVSPDTGEYYVTDVVQVLRKAGHGVSATITVPAEDARGINSRLDLAMVGRVMEDRIQLSLISEGVTIVDPDNTWIEADVTGGCDSVIYPFSFVSVGATLGERCRIGPFAMIVPGEVVPDGAVVQPVLSRGAGAS